MKLAKVLLHGPGSATPELIGWLSSYGEVHRLQFATNYIEAGPGRLTLSQVYLGANEEATRQILSARRDERLVATGRLPTFFENLLPEGENRDRLAEKRGCDREDQLELIVAAGHDLMGALEIVPEDDAPHDVLEWHVTQGLEPIEAGTLNEPVDDGFSLAGFVTKFSMVAQGQRYTIRRGTEAGQIIAKLASTRYPDLVENEAACYRLAEAVGIETARAERRDIAELDLGIELPFKDYLHVPRFDRETTPAGVRRVHVEELTQALGVRSRNKYQHLEAAMISLLQILWSQSPNKRDDVLEVFRRWTAFALMGNTDAHVKNWALIYRDGVMPSLSPAYDMVCVAAYFSGTEPRQFAINKKMNESLLRWDAQQAAMLARAAGLPDINKVRAVVRETMADASARWPALLAQAPDSMAAEIRGRLERMVPQRAQRMQTAPKTPHSVAGVDAGLDQEAPGL